MADFATQQLKRRAFVAGGMASLVALASLPMAQATTPNLIRCKGWIDETILYTDGSGKLMQIDLTAAEQSGFFNLPCSNPEKMKHARGEAEEARAERWLVPIAWLGVDVHPARYGFLMRDDFVLVLTHEQVKRAT